MPAKPRLEMVHFPAHALLIVEERLAEQESEGVRMPPDLDRTELALKILVVAALAQPAGGTEPPE